MTYIKDFSCDISLPLNSDKISKNDKFCGLLPLRFPSDFKANKIPSLKNSKLLQI